MLVTQSWSCLVVDSQLYSICEAHHHHPNPVDVTGNKLPRHSTAFAKKHITENITAFVTE
jgi:hypothetical protein